jgi:hypothetical protein
MSKSQWKAIALSLLFALSLTLLSFGFLVFPQKSSAQITSASEFRDVSPTDWYFQPLQALVEGYGIASAYSDGTFRANHPTTRGEMAVLMNSALDTISILLNTSSYDPFSPENLKNLQRLQGELVSEMNTLKLRQETAEGKLKELEHQLLGQLQ